MKKQIEELKRTQFLLAQEKRLKLTQLYAIQANRALQLAETISVAQENEIPKEVNHVLV